MEDGKLTDGKLLSGINYTTHSKLNQDCRVVIEECKLPFPKSETDSNILTRRQSVRLQGRRVQSTKETLLKKPKNKTKKSTSNDNKQSAVLLEKTDETPENELLISDNEIVSLPVVVITMIVCRLEEYYRN